MRRSLTLIATSLALCACVDDAASNADRSDALAAVAESGALPTLLVYKTAMCGCCNGWIEHMRSAGFTVDARDVRDLMTVKHDAGVPPAMTSCHTTIVDGYVVEGHVPQDQVKRLLAERPDIAGIGTPGMPIGSPGMEGRNAKPYEVFSFTADGSTALFAEIDPR